MTIKDWQCQECGRRMTLRASEWAVNGNDGCPGCGGSDIDLYVPSSDRDDASEKMERSHDRLEGGGWDEA